MNQPFIHLASSSPRRVELLAQLGVHCVVHPVDLDETPKTGEAPCELAERLARAKAEHAAVVLGEAIPVLAADTVVVVDDIPLGKPGDRAEAVAMLRKLAGRSHQVMTAVAVVFEGQVQSALNTSLVRFRKISSDECDAYWNTGEPADKAGAYAIQGLGAIFIEHIEGSYSGVMGLPLFETARLLAAAGVDVLGAAA